MESRQVGIHETRLRETLSPESSVVDVVSAYLAFYGISYITGEEVVKKLEELLLADNPPTASNEELKAKLDRLATMIGSLDLSSSSNSRMGNEQFMQIRHEMLSHFGGNLKLFGDFAKYSREKWLAANGSTEDQGEPFLEIEDSFQSGYSGMLRLFVNDVTYLWLVYLIDRGGDKWEAPTLQFIGAAISCYDQPDEDGADLFVRFEGEEQERMMRTSKPTFWFTTNFGTSHAVEFKETMYDGIFNSMHVQVVVNGQEAGYYFSY